MLEKEVRERNERIKLKTEKENTWALYKECKKFLEENERNWELMKLEREQEKRRKERLDRASSKKKEIVERVRTS